MADSKIPDPNAETALLDLFDAIFPPESRQIEEIDRGTRVIIVSYSDPPIPDPPIPSPGDVVYDPHYSYLSSFSRKA